MRQLLIGLVLSLVSAAASAEWVLMGGSDEVQIFADPTTKKRTGNAVRIWTLYDYAKPGLAGKFTYYSAQFYEQFDCVEQTNEALQANLFAGKMLSGESVVSPSQQVNKLFIAPNTIGATLIDFACK